MQLLPGELSDLSQRITYCSLMKLQFIMNWRTDQSQYQFSEDERGVPAALTWFLGSELVVHRLHNMNAGCGDDACVGLKLTPVES